MRYQYAISLILLILLYALNNKPQIIGHNCLPQ